MLRSPNVSLLSLSKLMLKKLEDTIKNSIIKISIERDMRIDVNTKFLVLYLLVAIKMFKAVGSPNCAILLSSKNVGIIIEYNPIPSVLISLVKTIFIVIPSTLVKKPPITSIRVDFINLFFIVQVYSINNKKINIFSKYPLKIFLFNI